MWKRIVEMPIKNRRANNDGTGQYPCLQQERAVLEVAQAERDAKQQRRPANGGPVRRKESPHAEERGDAAEMTLRRGQAAIELTEKLPPPEMCIRDSYSTPADLMVLSQAFQEGQDRGLATALSKTKAAGQCSITGAVSYDVAFIQMVPTPTGRRIIFITNRPRRLNEADPPAPFLTFDLAVGQFDINDADPAKSTGFLFPASKLVIDQQGEFHYDLAGSPWALENVLDSQGTPA